MTPIVDFEPIGRRISCDTGDTILSAAQKAGILLNATCGGEGTCGRCAVRLKSGRVSAHSLIEEAELGREHLNAGWRLACQAEVLSDSTINIPPESLVTAQRMQIEGNNPPFELAPPAKAVQARLLAPKLDDLRSDAARLREALGVQGLKFPTSVLRTLPQDLRANGFQCTVFLNNGSVAGIRPCGTEALGLAVDLGTTKLAAYLVDLATGVTLASAGAMNPQIAFGEDVMARIAHAIERPEGGSQLRNTIIEALNSLVGGLCEKAGRDTADIADGVLVGNTAMHHLFLGLPVRQLGLAPYVPAENAALDIPAGEAGLQLARGANLHLMPNVAGFVGADHMAMLLGSGMLDGSGVVLGMDIGTNTEISLMADGRHFACSTASGPAFEGAHIQHGMRAAPGAIERVLIRDGQVKLQTIDNQPATGLCGSGILDLVAQMRGAGILNSRGAFQNPSSASRLRRGEHGPEYLVAASTEGARMDITFSRRDVNEIQLAKGAIRTGMNILLRKAGLQEREIDTVIIAGAFGTYLDVQSGMDIGMFPRLEMKHYRQVGNAAGAGARMALLSTAKRAQAIEAARRVNYVELTAEKDFSSLFAKSLMLE